MPESPDLFGEVSHEALQALLEADGDLPLPQRRWAPMLVDLLRVIEAAQTRRGASNEAAFTMAVTTVTAVAEYFGGRPLYIPRGDRLLLALRDAEIFRRAKAGSIEPLSLEYGLGVHQIYRILRQQQALHLRKMQGRLFE
ncbi:Mor transcription activator family protein [Pseudoxanthomonas sp. UTMC 1351]|uniref:Mor transcription activator family protein n=1 Tax=Pseudoxanthomonas sp. UTMC 1351 TaxID=2695853 RepID=UPI0034CDC974